MIFVFIGENLLTGFLPTELGKLTNLKAIIIGECSSHFSMRGLKKESILTIIFAPETKDSVWYRENKNQLNGKIPTELGLLSSLEVIDLSKFILLHYQH